MLFLPCHSAHNAYAERKKKTFEPKIGFEFFLSPVAQLGDTGRWTKCDFNWPRTVLFDLQLQMESSVNGASMARCVGLCYGYVGAHIGYLYTRINCFVKYFINCHMAQPSNQYCSVSDEKKLQFARWMIYGEWTRMVCPWMVHRRKQDSRSIIYLHFPKIQANSTRCELVYTF